MSSQQSQSTEESQKNTANVSNRARKSEYSNSLTNPHVREVDISSCAVCLAHGVLEMWTCPGCDVFDDDVDDGDYSIHPKYNAHTASTPY